MGTQTAELPAKSAADNPAMSRRPFRQNATRIVRYLPLQSRSSWNPLAVRCTAPDQRKPELRALFGLGLLVGFGRLGGIECPHDLGVRAVPDAEDTVLTGCDNDLFIPRSRGCVHEV